MLSNNPTIIIDNGSYSIKAGFSCDNHPISMFRNVVGRPCYLQGSYGKEDYDVFLGDDAIEHSDGFNLSFPVVNGRIVNWDNMERVLHYVFYRELKAAPDDRNVMMSCSPNTPLVEKVKCCEIFFETLNCPSLCILPQSVLALYGFGNTSGLCVDIGYNNTNISPVYEGSVINYACTQTYLGGQQISEYFKELSQKRKLSTNWKNDQFLERMKRNCLCITPDSAMTRKDCCKTYRLPDGKEVNVTQEAFLASEMIFQPELVIGGACRYQPLHKAILNSALKCDPDIRPELFDGVILCGGTSMIPGFASRLTSELTEAAQCPIAVLSSCEAYAVTWLGGAVFASLSDSNNIWISKQLYEEYGEKIVKKKFS